MNRKYSFRILDNNECHVGEVFYNKDYEIDFRSPQKFDEYVFCLYIGKGYMRYYLSMITGKALKFSGHNYYKNWVKKDLIFPKSKKGEVCLENSLKYKIIPDEQYVEDWDTYYDKNKNILCIGDYNTNENDSAIEFCTNIVAVFENKYLKAIWVKDIEFEIDIN